VVLAALLISTSCTSDEQPEPSALPEAPAASPTPSKLPRLPIAEARLVGKYDVKVFVTSNTFDSKPAPRQLFRFVPRCEVGACDVTLVGAMAFTQGWLIGKLREQQSASISGLRFSADAMGARRWTSGPHAVMSPTRIAGRLGSTRIGRGTLMMSGRWSAGRGHGQDPPLSRRAIVDPVTCEP
jgi:hypothetical protein